MLPAKLTRSAGRPALLLAVVLWAAMAAAHSQAPPPATGPWRALLASDLAFLRQTLETRYIYAVYPGGEPWQSLYAPALARATEAAAKVDDFSGYRAVLSRLVSEFQDPHLRLTLALQPSRYQWPGVALHFSNGRYLVGTSRVPAIATGAELSACDGRPLDQWIDELAALEGGIPGLESTRVLFAARVLLDVGNPFRPRPARCTIGGVDRELVWTSIGAEAWAAATTLRSDAPEAPTGLSDFGTRGAWIRLPSMTPRNKSEADAYHAVIREAPALRDREVIVFDVRGNGGGAYNWFIAMLRALYGADYASYHARERLKIQPVFVAGTYPTGPRPANADPFNTPDDADLSRVIDEVRPLWLKGGREVTVVGASDDRRRLRPAGPPPPNPVRARVFVLTDHGCGSACLSFVDEMLQFPGVRQIGRDTWVDRRSGSSLPYALPSGIGTVLVPSMVRENRERGENVPRVPVVKFSGDLSDTSAAQRWVLDELLNPGDAP